MAKEEEEACSCRIGKREPRQASRRLCLMHDVRPRSRALSTRGYEAARSAEDQENVPMSAYLLGRMRTRRRPKFAVALVKQDAGASTG